MTTEPPGADESAASGKAAAPEVYDFEWLWAVLEKYIRGVVAETGAPANMADQICADVRPRLARMCEAIASKLGGGELPQGVGVTLGAAATELVRYSVDLHGDCVAGADWPRLAKKMKPEWFKGLVEGGKGGDG